MSQPPTVSDLRDIPGVGPSIEHDLIELGIARKADLVGRDPQALYDRHCDLKGCRVDRCVLYVFRCAVYVASHSDPDPELSKWWAWKDPVTSDR